MAATSQLYALFLFTRIHTPDEASIIFILIGYAIWLQMFEFGVAQALQNRINCRKISLTESAAVIVLHYIGMLLFSTFLIVFPEVQALLLPSAQPAARAAEIGAFSFGMALMVIATNNIIIQRVLIVSNRGMTANTLLFLQSFFAIVGLMLYQRYGQTSLLKSIFIYLSPPIFVYVPIILKLVRKIIRRWKYINIRRLSIIYDAAGFWGLNILSSIFLGADYYFVAHYLSSTEVISYHFSARFFFLSYVAYFAYVQHQAKNLNPATLARGVGQVKKILKESICIGLVSVALILGGVIVLEYWKIFDLFTSKGLVITSLLLTAAFYYSIRVFRDVGLVVLWNLGVKSALYKVYLLEVTLGLVMLGVLAPQFAGVGIFLAMALTSLVSTAVIFFVLNKILSAPTASWGKASLLVADVERI